MNKKKYYEVLYLDYGNESWILIIYGKVRQYLI